MLKFNSICSSVSTEHRLVTVHFTGPAVPACDRRTDRQLSAVVCSTSTSVVVLSPRANSSYEGRRLRLTVHFTGPVNLVDSNTIYFQYTGNPNVSALQPAKLLSSSVLGHYHYSIAERACFDLSAPPAAFQKNETPNSWR